MESVGEATMTNTMDEKHHRGSNPDYPEVGSVHEKRNFGVFSVLGIGYSICNTPLSTLISLGIGIGSGGPVIYIWGMIIMALVAFCIAISLSELSSAYPSAGGQYVWVAKLAPRRIRRVASYITGYLGWAGAVCTCASITLGLAQMIIGMIILRNPEFVYSPWMGFVAYECANIVIFSLNLIERFLPTISRASLYYSVTTFVIIFISILAASKSKQSADFVFTGYVNLSGWENRGITLLTGVLGVNWGFSCLDACTHMAEEIPDPRRNIPKSLLGTVVVGISTALPLCIVILFCLTDITALMNTPTMTPSLQLFVQAFNGTAGAIALQSLMVVAVVGSIFGIHTWQSRIAWSFARDNGFPFSRYIGAIAPAPFETPIWAHAWCCMWVALLGCLYLGSIVAFNSFVSGGLLFQYLTYSLCVLSLLAHGRKNVEHGPFWLPRIGLIANLVVLAWTVIATVFYSFPSFYPVQPNTMNYVSCVLVGGVLLAWFNWAVHGRKYYMIGDSELE